MHIIINADDFGLNHDINMAIVEAFEKGYITNTTIMANMPGFEEAVKLSKEYGFYDRVGLHFNIFTGQPLFDGIKKVPLFYQNGEMSSYRFFHQSTLFDKIPTPFNRNIRKTLQEEAERQVRRYIEAGFPEMHFDSHGHSHTFPLVWKAIAPVFKKHNFKTTRISLNLPSSKYKTYYKSAINALIRREFSSTQYFASGSGFISSIDRINNLGSSVEIMVHPTYDQKGKLKNQGNHPDLTEIIEKARSVAELCSFSFI